MYNEIIKRGTEERRKRQGKHVHEPEEMSSGLRTGSKRGDRSWRWDEDGEGESKRQRDRERESNKEDQRHVEFTLTFPGCAVMKVKRPWRERRLRAGPVSSPAPLISCVSPTEPKTSRKGSPFVITPGPPSAPRNVQSKHRLARHWAPLRGRRSVLDEPLPRSCGRRFSFFLMF